MHFSSVYHVFSVPCVYLRSRLLLAIISETARWVSLLKATPSLLCRALVLQRNVPFRGGHQLLYLPLKQVNLGAQAVYALNNLACRSLELGLHILQQALHLCAGNKCLREPNRHILFYTSSGAQRTESAHVPPAG